MIVIVVVMMMEEPCQAITETKLLIRSVTSVIIIAVRTYTVRIRTEQQIGLEMSRVYFYEVAFLPIPTLCTLVVVGRLTSLRTYVFATSIWIGPTPKEEK